MIRQARFHRRRDAQGLMHAAEVVVGKMQCTRCFQIRQFLAESVRQSRESANRHSHREILPLDETRRNVPRIRIASPHLGYNFDDWAWGVPPSGVVLPVVAKQFDELGEVHVQAERKRDAVSGIASELVRSVTE
jgi:hypothetical protein